MLQLLDLPNEILVHITCATANADLDNLTSTCKTIRDLAGPALTLHQDRKKTYAHTVYGNPDKEDERTTWIHPTLMLQDLLANDLLCYPRELTIEDHDEEYNDWDDGRDYHSDSDTSDIRDDRYSDVDRALESFPKSVGPLVKSCPYVNGDETIVDGISTKGYIGATLGFLLTILPNLATINITDYNEMSDGAENLKIIFENILIISYGPDASSTGCAPPLQNLRNMTFTRSDEGVAGDTWGLCMYAPAFYLPSMRSIRASFINPSDEWEYAGFQSSIEELVFDDSEIHPRNISTYLQANPNLKHFRFDFGTKPLFDSGGRFIPVAMIEILRASGSQSLRTLELSNDVHSPEVARAGGHYVGSLKDFQALETVKLGSTMFIRPLAEIEDIRAVAKVHYHPQPTLEKGLPRKLIDILPSSIACVEFGYERCLHGYGADNDVIVAMLQDLPKEKAKSLPKLELIKFKMASEMFKPEDKALLRACRDAGVEIKGHGKALN